MKKKTLLISENTIKDSSLIEINVASKTLKVIIADVQYNQLRKIIGKTKYDSLLTEVENSLLPIDDLKHEAMSEESKELIYDYIQPFLIAATVCDFIVLNSTKITNKGLLKLNDNNASSVDDNSLEQLKNYYDSKLATAKLDLIDYTSSLDENIGCGNNDSSVTGYSTGLYIEKYNDFSDYFNRYNSRTRYL
jgi:hypothetical protein